MVRTYQRKSTQGSYGSERLALAVAAVHEGQSIRGAGADYGTIVNQTQTNLDEQIQQHVVIAHVATLEPPANCIQFPWCDIVLCSCFIWFVGALCICIK